MESLYLLAIIIYFAIGWNPLLCSPQSDYFVFFFLWIVNSFILCVLYNINSRFKYSRWLCTSWLFIFLWSLAGDYARAYLNIGFKSNMVIVIMLVVVDILIYLIALNDNAVDLEWKKKEMLNRLEKINRRGDIIKIACDSNNNRITTLEDHFEAFSHYFQNYQSNIHSSCDPLKIMERNERRYQLLMKPLSDVPFFIDNPRILNALREHEVLSMFHLCQYDRNSMRKMHGIGMGSLSKIEDFLTSNDLSFGLDVFSIVKRHDLYAFYCK